MYSAYTFEDIRDFIGFPVSSWPRLIYAAYQKQTYTAADRLKICIFNWLNGFDNKVFIEFALAKGALVDRRALQDVLQICTVLEGRSHHIHDWYGFSLAENRWVYLDGTPKYY